MFAVQKTVSYCCEIKLGTHWGFKWILTEDFKLWIKSNIILT